MEKDANREWHLEKSVSLSHIISTAAAIATLIGMAAHFDKRLSLAEQAISVQAMSEARQDTALAVVKSETQIALRDINLKLDRLLEAKK